MFMLSQEKGKDDCVYQDDVREGIKTFQVNLHRKKVYMRGEGNYSESGYLSQVKSLVISLSLNYGAVIYAANMCFKVQNPKIAVHCHAHTGFE